MSKSNLKDCPFCGGNHLKLWGNYHTIQMTCMRCGAMGPKAESYNGEEEIQQMAIKLWQNREEDNGSE